MLKKEAKEFQFSNYKTAKYIFYNQNDREKLIEIAKEALNLFKHKHTKLIVSINGALNNLAIDSKIEESLKNGLIEMAEKLNSCIITDGGNRGVSRLIGDAIENCLYDDEFTTIGIATWQKIEGRECIEKKVYFYLFIYLKQH